MMQRLAIAILAVILVAAPAVAEPLRLAVAANFRPAIADLEKEYERGSAVEIDVSIGSTGQLAAQIIHGAPFDVFLAADRASPARLAADGHALADTIFTYASGRLALLTPGRVVPADGVIPDLGDLSRVSIANPRTAPYGVAAMEVLDSLDIAGVQLVLAQNASSVVAAVASGAAPAGLTSLSLAKTSGQIPAWAVPADLHEPLDQDAVLLARAVDNQAARDFLDWLKGPAARRIIKAHGYSLD